MMQRVLTMPRLGETMEEGTIVGWLVEPGTAFKRGDPILELETDKTMVEYPALGDGVLDEVIVGPGDRIAVGAPIAKVTVSNAADWSDDEAANDTAAPAVPKSSAAILAMPRLGETMEEGVIVQWLVAEGATYARGDSILEIETDKTVAEVPALSEGRLLRILAQPGERLNVGAPIAEVEGDVEAADPAPHLKAAIQETPAAKVASAAPSRSDERLRATPLARRAARQRRISLENLAGTGRRGRIERADVERAGAQTATSGWLDTSKGRIAVEVEGQIGQMILMIHGFAGDRTAWAATASALRRAGRRTTIFDLPGHGETEVEAPDLADLTEAALTVAESAPGPLLVVGHSLGAAVAVAVAERLGNRASGLVLLTPAGCGPRIGAEFVHGMAQASTIGEVGHLLRLLGPKGGALSDAALAGMAQLMGRGRLRALADKVASPEGRQKIDLLRQLAKLPETLPVRAVFGTEDRVVSATDALNMPARVAVHFLPTGHMPQWDAPREVVDLILKGFEK